MTGAPPKPERRGPKPKRRIQRHAPIPRRSSPVRGEGKKPKKSKVVRLKRGWVERVTDEVVSLWFRSRRRCEVCLKPLSVPELQWSHFWERTWRRIRYDFRNACASCSGCHVFATHHGTWWAEWCRGYVTAQHGAEAWSELSTLAKSGPLPDHAAILRELWLTPEVQGALAECSPSKVVRLAREVQKVMQFAEKTAA